MNRRKVFMSYSWKDMTVASRLYDDLTRSQVCVWRDQIDGDPTSNFLNEFLQKIDECDDFIVLDSKNYRNKSNWCLTEIERCFENIKKRKSPRVIVCLLDDDGEWRWRFNNEKAKKLLSELNLFKYIKLYYDGIYDNNSIYQQAIRKLIALFEERYIPWEDIPESRDFIEEISADNVILQDEDKELLLTEYKNIIRLINLQRDVKQHFLLWIEDCRSFGLSLFFPRWSYCIWLGKKSNGGIYDNESYENFKLLINDFPNDPRGYRGLGSVQAKLGYYQDAEIQFRKALHLLELPENIHHKNYAEYEVKRNLAQTLINQGRYVDATPLWKDCFSYSLKHNMKDVSTLLNYNLCLVSTEQFTNSLEMLLSVNSIYKLEGEYQKVLGLTYTALLDDRSALECFVRAYTLHPSPENAFLYMCRLLVLGECVSDEFVDLVLSCDRLTDDDNYWKGAICYYILRNNARAKYFFNLCEGEYDWYA